MSENQDWYAGSAPAPAAAPAVPAKSEGALHRRIRENSGPFLGLAALAGAGFALCFCEAGSLGVNVPVFALLWLFCVRGAFRRLGISSARRDGFSAAGILLLAAAVCLTANEFVQAVCCLGILLLACLLLLDAFCDTAAWEFGKMFTALFRLLVSALGRLPEPFRHLFALRKSAEKPHWGRQVLLGLVIAVPLAAAAAGLLSSADLVFRDLLSRLWRVPDYFNTVLRALGCFLLLFLGTYCALCALADGAVPSAVRPVSRGGTLTAVTFTGVLAAVYLVFCGIQVVCLFGGAGLPAGYTYASYARQGFFQLLFASVLNVALVIFTSRCFQSGRALRILLTVVCGCTYITAASSAYRMLLYVNAYGLTFLRLFVLWFLGVLALLLTGTVVSVYRSSFRLFRFCLTVTLVLWLGFAFARPDRIAAKYDIARFGLDESTVSCLLNDLSDDAVPVMAQYDYAGEFSSEWEEKLTQDVPARLDKAGVRGFNFALWEAARAAEGTGHGK